MSECTQLPMDHPMMCAWSAYKATPEYANSRSWAKHSEHVDGSLWASFMVGWEACGGEQLRAELAASREREARMRALIADDGYAMTFQSPGQYRTALLRALAEGAQG